MPFVALHEETQFVVLTDKHLEEQESVSTELPSSHCSPQPTTESPQTAATEQRLKLATTASADSGLD